MCSRTCAGTGGPVRPSTRSHLRSGGGRGHRVGSAGRAELTKSQRPVPTQVHPGPRKAQGWGGRRDRDRGGQAREHRDSAPRSGEDPGGCPAAGEEPAGGPSWEEGRVPGMLPLQRAQQPTYRCRSGRRHPAGSRPCSRSGRSRADCGRSGHRHSGARPWHTRSHLHERCHPERAPAPSPGLPGRVGVPALPTHCAPSSLAW